MRALGVVRGVAIAAVAMSAAVFGIAHAQAPAASTNTSANAGDGGGGDVGGCVESVTKGGNRPVVTDSFPLHGTSGWAAALSITVKHGKGEHVFRAGLDLGNATEAKKYLQKAGFVIPDQDGGAAAQLWTEPEEKDKPQAITHLELPLVILPEKPGRNTMDLPPLPIAIARANGEVITLCTHPHLILVEDPTANTPQASPKLNPPPRPQREEWTALKKALLWGSLGLLVGALLAYFGYRYATKPKPVPPPPPPRPPWEIALEKLDEVRHAGLLDAKRHAEYFDRVSDAVRGYLGARFGFDGLESTSDEILAALRKQAGGFVRLETAMLDATEPASATTTAPSPGVPIDEIRRFLGDCDLVKFANLKPAPEQCSSALSLGEHIVRSTMPFSRAFGSSDAAKANEPAPAPMNAPRERGRTGPVPSYAPPLPPVRPVAAALPDAYEVEASAKAEAKAKAEAEAEAEAVTSTKATPDGGGDA